MSPVMISGVVTEADWDNGTPASIKPYLGTVLPASGPQRWMFGTGWPVGLLATEYERLLDVVIGRATPRSRSERDALFGRRAAAFYGIEQEA